MNPRLCKPIAIYAIEHLRRRLDSALPQNQRAHARKHGEDMTEGLFPMTVL
jgi:hypothetical protein